MRKGREKATTGAASLTSSLRWKRSMEVKGLSTHSSGSFPAHPPPSSPKSGVSASTEQHGRPTLQQERQPQDPVQQQAHQ